jgi:ribosomal protein L11 methyltransferase
VWQVSISTTAEAEEAVAGLLERRFNKPASVYLDAITGARQASVYPEKLPEPARSVQASLREELRQLRQCGLDPGPAKISVKLLPRENWAESWKRHFKPLEIEGALLIKPGWIRRRARPGQRVIVLDPGLSFGTGQHPTTLFCLRQLVRCRIAGQAQSVLDIGTGSGILAIAAAKLGYGPVEAFDYDPVAVRVSRRNAVRNRVADRVWPQQKDLSALPARIVKTYNIICANLACDLLTNEAPKICARLKPGGTLIVAGILRREFSAVRKILRRFNLTLQVSLADKYWKSGQFVLS